MKVKICGICRAADAADVAAAGADYMGVILAARGPRQQTEAQAALILDGAPHLMHVGVFADQAVADVARLANALDLNIIQLHGAESSGYINELECETDCAIWKSVSLENATDLERLVDQYADDIDGLLLDAHTGGSGQTFDWHLAANAREMLPASVTLIAAGGLNPDNVRDAIAALRPDVVDVASGVEAGMGIKDANLIRQFVKNAKA